MNDITASFGTLYHPVKAFVVYQKDETEKNVYVESYDIGKDGTPINAHPLTARESMALVKALDTSEELKSNFLKPAGILPKNVLYINPDRNGYAVWHTPEQHVNLFFSKDLTIPNGKAFIPSLIWKASKKTLQIYAYESDAELNERSSLYHAPFFNIYKNGKVCMGNVAVDIQSDCLLEEFIGLWQQYFFNSYFSHLMQEHNPVKGNIVQLWKDLVGSRKKFPQKTLIKNGLTFKNLIQ